MSNSKGMKRIAVESGSSYGGARGKACPRVVKRGRGTAGDPVRRVPAQRSASPQPRSFAEIVPAWGSAQQPHEVCVQVQDACMCFQTFTRNTTNRMRRAGARRTSPQLLLLLFAGRGRGKGMRRFLRFRPAESNPAWRRSWRQREPSPHE